MRKRRGRQNKVAMIPANAMALLHDAGVVNREDEPVAATGYYTVGGRPCRVRARFRDGWLVDLRIRSDGSFSWTKSINFKVGGP